MLQIPAESNGRARLAQLDRWGDRWRSRCADPDAGLQRLRDEATVRSVAAAGRLSGIRVTDDRVAGLLRGEIAPLAEERPLLGYAAGLRYPLPEVGALLSTETLCGLNAVLSGEAEAQVAPSSWRREPLHREAFDGCGRATGRVFTTLPPWLIPRKIDDLLTWLEYELRARKEHPVLVVGAFTVALLGASPFPRYNGRMARLLAARLLERAGYPYVRFSSLEAEMESMRAEFDEAQHLAETGLWNGGADLAPWLETFVEALGRVGERVAPEALQVSRETPLPKLPPLQLSILEAVREHGLVSAGLLLRETGANRNTLKDNVRRLVERGVLEKTGSKRGTRYQLASGQAEQERGAGVEGR